MSVEHLGGNDYKIYVEMGYDDYGKRRRRTRTITATSNRDLRKQELEFELLCMKEAEEEELSRDMGKITFDKFFDRWWTNHVSTLAIGTHNSYHYFIPMLKEHFGKMKMKDIKRLHIEEFFVQERKLGRKSLGTKLIMLKGIFGKAIEWEILKYSPVTRYKFNDADPDEREIYNEDELTELFTLIDTLIERDRLMILAATLGALRRGEVLGIGTDSPNYTENYIKIERSLNYDRELKTKYLGPTKGKKSRKVYYPEIFMKDLKKFEFKQNELKNMYGDRWELLDGVDLFFRTSTGVIMHPQSFTNLWAAIRKKLNLKEIGLHDLRHSAATYLASEGAEMRSIQKILGHKKLSTTQDVYIHATNEEEKVAPAMFEKLL